MRQFGSSGSPLRCMGGGRCQSASATARSKKIVAVMRAILDVRSRPGSCMGSASRSTAPKDPPEVRDVDLDGRFDGMAAPQSDKEGRNAERLERGRWHFRRGYANYWRRVIERVYLCGAINGCTDAQANDWRINAPKVPWRGTLTLSTPCGVTTGDARWNQVSPMKSRTVICKIFATPALSLPTA